MNKATHHCTSRKISPQAWRLAKTAYRHFDNAGSSLGRWITTDHTGFSRSMLNMPSMGFWSTCKYVVTTFLISMLGVIGSALMVYLMIAYGIPYFIFGSIP